ncbi:IS701 family transposase [Streptomyces echinoruber]|uniref:ISXo8 transposase n=1 Tax=Streptomyces echinoruber TaxID=68898 RepID=A0A918VHD7_9ACTN|nr:transposase [Streptomyces echinoruber]GGZ97852.1 putative ISXo8 transposase [Streptomyces echinoruber]
MSGTELATTLFATLPRSDQRRKGEEYIRGLLATKGRKSIRNMAAPVGGSAREQSLHHFVSNSTWHWMPVRRALARYVVRSALPEAYVVHTMVIPKAGGNSVGVYRCYVPQFGQIRGVQRAVGVWAAAQATSVPVNWRLHIPQDWLENGIRRRQAAIPDDVREETPEESAAAALLATRDWGLPARPAVLDARGMDVPALVRRLRSAGVPYLVRIDGVLRLAPADPARFGRGVAEALPARQIMAAAGLLRRPVVWRDHGPGHALRTAPVATVRVRGTGRAAGPRGTDDLLLLGVGDGGRPWPAELWLTDLTEAGPVALLRLSRLLDRVERDFRDISERVGIRDYAGRSYCGWHRHTTLASAAHALAALGGMDEGRFRAEENLRQAS